jgi:hypothetical protein
MKVTPGIFMKTKEEEKQISGIRCRVSESEKSEVRSPKSAPPNVLGHSVS